MVPQQEPGDSAGGPEERGPDGADGRSGRPGSRPGETSGEEAPRGDRDATDDGNDAFGPQATPAPLTQQIGRVVVVVLVAMVGAFAVVNSQPVDFSWVFGETQVRQVPSGQGTTGGVPLILLLLATLSVGVILGVLVAWQVGRGRRARRMRKGR